MKGLCMIDWQIITKKCQRHSKVYRQIENSQIHTYHKVMSNQKHLDHPVFLT